MAAAPLLAPKPLYIVVVDGDGDPNAAESFRYTRAALQSALQLMGCKPRHAFKISRRAFEDMRLENPGADDENPVEIGSPRLFEFELYKRRTTVVVPRERFLDVVCSVLAVYKYVGPNQRADLLLACRIRERKESVTIFLSGTSGCGKSTLSTLLGSRLGITTVVSTDSIRHMMRSYVNEKQNDLLWASTYNAGECLDPVAVAEAKAKRKAKRCSFYSCSSNQDEKDRILNGHPGSLSCGIAQECQPISDKQLVIEGYKAQSEMVIDSLDRLITAWEERKESAVVEGVHLSLNFVMGLMKKHPSIIPFMICISNEDKHTERFAVRAKYMALDPAKNKYVKYIRNIRLIQEYLCNRADKFLVPKINNTNVDKSVAAIHATVFSSLRRKLIGEQFYDATTNTVTTISEEYRRQCAANSLSSKGMFQLIRRQGSSRRLMALMNGDGSVHKAWPVDSGPATGNSINGSMKDARTPIYGPLKVGKAETVNLQFGTFGISAWPSDTGCTNLAGDINSSANEAANSTWHDLSCSACDRKSDRVAQTMQMNDENFVQDESDDESDDFSGTSNEDFYSADHEFEGSVDENSTKSDEEFEDLAMSDGTLAGYLIDEDDEGNNLASMNWSHDSKPSRISEGSADSPDSVLSTDKTSRRNITKKCKRSLSDSRDSRNQSHKALSKSISFALREGC